MNNIINLTRFMSTILLKQNATIFFALLTMVGVLISVLFANTNIGLENKLLKDLLLTMHNFFIHIIVIFYTFTILEKYKMGSISIIPLALNIKRYEYIITMFLTIIMATLPIITTFLLIDGITLYLVDAKNIIDCLLQITMFYLSAIVLGFVIITLFFCLSKTSIKAITLGLILYLIGNSLDEMYYLSQYATDENFKILAKTLYYSLPNFSMFDFQTYVVNNQPLDYLKNILYNIIYFITLSIVLVSLSIVSFKTTKVIPNDS